MRNPTFLGTILGAIALIGLALTPVAAESAKQDAPGQKQAYPGQAKKKAPGQLQKKPGQAKKYAPGQTR